MAYWCCFKTILSLWRLAPGQLQLQDQNVSTTSDSAARLIWGLNCFLISHGGRLKGHDSPRDDGAGAHMSYCPNS